MFALVCVCARHNDDKYWIICTQNQSLSDSVKVYVWEQNLEFCYNVVEIRKKKFQTVWRKRNGERDRERQRTSESEMLKIDYKYEKKGRAIKVQFITRFR